MKMLGSIFDKSLPNNKMLATKTRNRKSSNLRFELELRLRFDFSFVSAFFIGIKSEFLLNENYLSNHVVDDQAQVQGSGRDRNACRGSDERRALRVRDEVLPAIRKVLRVVQILHGRRPGRQKSDTGGTRTCSGS